MVCEPSGRKWHPHNSDEENNGGAELKADRDQPGCVGLTFTSTTDEVSSAVDVSISMEIDFKDTY